MEIMIDHYFWKIIADESYDIEDSHLQNARKFYKSCVFTRNWKTAQLAYQSLIRDLFGGWELIPSISTDTKKMSLTDLFLPIISQTGSSLLFSINIKQDLFAVNTDMDKFEEDYYKLAFGIGVSHFEQSQLTIAFQMLVDLSNEISMTQGLHVSEFNEIISMKELKSICPQIDWSYLLKELLKQTGYTKSKQLSIIVEGRYQLKHRCELYGDVMKTKNDKSAFRTIIIMDFLINQLLQSMNLSPTGTDNNSYSCVLFDSAGTSLTGLTGLMLSSVIETKTSCIIDQYRLYEFTDYKALQTDTRDEILADIGGLKASYYTYRRLYEKYSNSVNQNYNLSLISDQLFFLSFAQSLCGHHSGTSLLIHSIVVPHVIERYRVFGALINSKEFAHAYGCPVGSPMNPDTKCDIW
ncbi:unnamed protein product [Schistosoma bovis]|nr:unnamed protein product [Schistosoma bovis]